MSTPINSTGPTPPTGTSNPVPLRSWFTSIVDWIKSLTPAGATVYDTGWVTLLSGTLSVVARRTGMTVVVRVDLAHWVDTGSNDVVSINGGAAVLPVDMRPAAEVYGAGIGNQQGVAIQGLALAARPGGSLAIIKPRAVSSGIAASATYICG